MKILGIDPGTATTGYGLIYVKDGMIPTLLDFGWILTEKNGEPSRRLNEIFKQAMILFRRHSPDIIAIESLFFYSNAKTAMRVGQANGVILLAAARSKIAIVEYPPAKVKLTVTGSGRADKTLMKKTIKKLFRLRTPKKKKTHFDDVADAIAVAWCHATMISSKSPVTNYS